MTYIKTNWQTGDTITANKLNNIENGIESLSASGILVVHENNGTLDKTWQEIYNAIRAGSIVYIVHEESSVGITIYYVLAAYYLNELNGVYYVEVLSGANSMTSYSTTTANGYPTLEEMPV